jgi:hypothetical protein
MKPIEYDNNTSVPIGVLDTDNSQYVASGDSDTFTPGITAIRVTPTAGGVWIAIGTSPTATADTDGSHYVSQAQDFAVLGGDKINTTGAINITPFK